MYENILLNSIEQDGTNIVVNGGAGELNSGVTYLVDEQGRYYYRKDIQKLGEPTEQQLQKDRKDAQIYVEGDNYQTATLMPDNGGDEISYILVMQEPGPLINIDVNVDKIEKNENNNKYIFQEKEAESIDKGADNFEESSNYTLVTNEITDIQTNFACNFCPYTNKKRYLLLRHLKTHCAERPHMCRVCDRGFKTIVSLQNHMNMHNGVKPYICKQCKSPFTTSGELVRHMKYRHTHEKPHKCTECDYASVELSKLKRHVRGHTGERPYQCSHCSYACQDSFKLKRHMRIHTGEKPYKCDFCRATFSQSNSLKLHKLIHNVTEKPVFQCKLCPTKCGRKTDLRSHMKKLHNSEKPLQCNKCDKSFPDRYTCKIHNKTHVGEKCYKCEECSYASTTRKNLQSHKVKHTNEKPFICDQCSQMFTSKGNLIRHLAIHDPHSGQKEKELGLNLSSESRNIFFGENINTDNSAETVEIIQLNLESDQLEGGQLLTVADDNGQQYLLLEVIDATNDTDQQINISPEEFLNKKDDVQESVNKEEISETIKLNDVNQNIEKTIDACFSFDEDYEPVENDDLCCNDDILLNLI